MVPLPGADRVIALAFIVGFALGMVFMAVFASATDDEDRIA